MKTLLLFFGLCLSFAGISQKCPCFNIQPDSLGCAPYTFTVKDCSNGSVEYVYETNGPPTAVTSHTYDNPGLYFVTQSGNFTCGSTATIKKITHSVLVKPTPNPKITSFPCANNKALIIANDVQYDEYILTSSTNKKDTIKKGSSGIVDLNFSPISIKGNYFGAKCGGQTTLTSTGNVILPNVSIFKLTVNDDLSADIFYNGISSEMYQVQIKDNVSNTYSIYDTIKNSSQQSLNLKALNKDLLYCVKMRAIDYCGQTGSFSNEVCTIKLKGTAVPEKNNLTWETNSSGNNFSIAVNGQSNSDFQVRPQPRQYSDTIIKCGNNYCYQITETTPENSISISNKICLNAISKKKPFTISDLQSDVKGGFINLEWPATVSLVNSYTVISSTDKSVYNFLGNSNTTGFVDILNYPIVNQICYKVSYTDNCGNTSDYSSLSCPVFLSGFVVDALSRNLIWKPYVGWAEGVKEYIVEKTDENGNPYSSVSVGNSLEYIDKGLDTLEQVINFRIKAVSTSGKISYSNIFKALQKGNFNMPNAFTPNGDGLNDIFHAEGLFIREFNLEIWNRNGEGVFATKSFRQGWDGKVNGQNAPVDTYMYKVQATDKQGNVYKRNGTLQLIK